MSLYMIDKNVFQDWSAMFLEFYWWWWWWWWLLLLLLLLCFFALLQGVPFTSSKWSYNPYKWPYNWVTGVIIPISGVMDPYSQLVGAHLVEGQELQPQNLRIPECPPWKINMQPQNGGLVQKMFLFKGSFSIHRVPFHGPPWRFKIQNNSSPGQPLSFNTPEKQAANKRLLYNHICHLFLKVFVKVLNSGTTQWGF